jgi:hypothetical protein
MRFNSSMAKQRWDGDFCSIAVCISTCCADPRHPQTRRVLHEISGVILDIPVHRLNAPSLRAQAEAGILAGFAARLAGIHAGARQGLLNDAMLYLQAIEQGHALLTRNIRDFDWFEQLLPSGRALFYRAV